MELFIIIGGVFAVWGALMTLLFVMEAFELRDQTKKIKRRQIKVKRHYRPFNYKTLQGKR